MKYPIRARCSAARAVRLRLYVGAERLARFDSRMAGIGTFCHEFGHVLGWPDF
ncbi:MAG: hypothetical protein ACLR76_09350 [Alistipes sp.]